MKYETSVIYLEQVPKIVVDAGFDLATFLSFAVTIIIFAIGTWLTIRSSNKNSSVQRNIFNETVIAQDIALDKTLKAQAQVARSNAIKESRQAWIDELRQCVSQILSLFIVINSHQQLKKATEDFARSLSSNHAETAANIVVGWGGELASLRSKMFELRYRVELLSNMKEDLFVELGDQITHGVDICENSSRQEVLIRCELIKLTAQKILKIEWDKTKNMH